MTYEDVAVKFVAIHPIGSLVTTGQLVGFARDEKNGLATDLLIADPRRQASTIRRHLNAGGASFDLDEDTRFQIVVTDAKTGQMLVVAYADSVRDKVENTFTKMTQGAMNPLRQSRRAINQVKLEELSDERRQELEASLEEITEAARPLSSLLGEIATNRWVRRLIAKGFTEEAARSLIEVLPLLRRDMKLIDSTKF